MSKINVKWVISEEGCDGGDGHSCTAIYKTLTDIDNDKVYSSDVIAIDCDGGLTENFNGCEITSKEDLLSLIEESCGNNIEIEYEVDLDNLEDANYSK